MCLVQGTHVFLINIIVSVGYECIGAVCNIASSHSSHAEISSYIIICTISVMKYRRASLKRVKTKNQPSISKIVKKKKGYI